MKKKICVTCGLTKEINMFNRAAHKIDGFNTVCKDCHNEQQKVWRDKRIAKYPFVSDCCSARMRVEEDKKGYLCGMCNNPCKLKNHD